MHEPFTGSVPGLRLPVDRTSPGWACVRAAARSPSLEDVSTAADKPLNPESHRRETTPSAVRLAGGIAVVEGVILLGAAVYMIVHAAMGYREETVVISGYGTAAWFVIMGGAVAATGAALLRGRQWGRGVVVIAQLVLLPVAWYMSVGSHQWVPGILVGIAALTALVCMFRRESLEWYAG